MIKKIENIPLIEGRKVKKWLRIHIRILKGKKEIVKRLEEGKAKDMNGRKFQTYSGIT